MSKTISVIIATNRGGPYLADTVDSVKAQTSAVHEIILVDDGAPDGALERFAREHGLRYLRSPGKGVSTARNAGAAVASGDWLIFLDDDDVWHPRRIEAQRAALDAAPHAIASHTGGWYIDADGTAFGTGWRVRQVPALDMLRGAVPLPRITTLLVRHDIFEEIGGFHPGIRIGEDNELIRRLLMHGESVAVDDALVGYRRHSGNVSRRMLDGRLSAPRSVRRLREEARDRGQQSIVAALDERLQKMRHEAADENLGELITAVRHRDGAYAARLVGYVLLTPWSSAQAVVRRIRS
ncbi:glycosyltransferase family 2 protein [Microbacterium murale]|uniref:Glycosyltransferase involved in cell wall biosynthesis n=1 Tax=Microbacterium murale TaxID=1081040 RepID=A0ABU0PDA2_9MICO|nr:glycosyltransferase family A protein [Microbacterium murale]MDQ0644604.1 glycosyltransferase involved in cell wall biosynthesis [Microbacterium murale]